MKKINSEYIRSSFFGIEDSLVSTTGVIAGLSAGTSDKNIVILGGVVAIIVEALSMGAGQYLTTDTVQEVNHDKNHHDRPLRSGILMLFSYAIAGLIPLAPILLFDLPLAVYISVVFALIGLGLLGYAKSRFVKTPPTKAILKVVIVGGLATIIGVIAGLLLKV